MDCPCSTSPQDVENDELEFTDWQPMAFGHSGRFDGVTVRHVKVTEVRWPDDEQRFTRIVEEAVPGAVRP